MKCPKCNSIKVLTIKRINNGLGTAETKNINDKFKAGKAEFSKRCADCNCSTAWFLQKEKIVYNIKNIF